MDKTTLSEIKHLIHKNKTNIEQHSSKNNYSAPIKISLDEHSSSAALPSKNTNGNIIFQKLSDHKSSISPETEEDLRKVEGLFTIKELSQQFNLPTSTLYYWAKKNHYQPKSGNISLSISDELQEKISNQLSTRSISELAKEHNISYHILYYWLKKQGFTAKKTSEFPLHIQQELRKKCQNSSLKNLAQEYGLSEQTMRSRLKNIGCFSDGQGGFLVIDKLTGEKIKSFYCENGITETAKKFYTTKIAINSFLKTND